MDINILTENVLRRMPANLTQIEQARYNLFAIRQIVYI